MNSTGVIFLETIAGLVVIFNLATIALCVWVDYFANLGARRESLPELKQLLITSFLALVIVNWASEPVLHVKSIVARCLAPVQKTVCSLAGTHHKVASRHQRTRFRRSHLS